MAYITSNLGPPKGFHPTSKTTIHLPEPASSYKSCTLNLYYTLPPPVFVDTHELAQREASYTFKHWGSRDLEKPVHALPDEISELLLDVNFLEGAGRAVEEGMSVDVDVPMHLRYGKPRTPQSSEEVKTGPYEEIRAKGDGSSISLPQHIMSALPGADSEKDRVLMSILPPVDVIETSSTLFLPLGNPRNLAIVEGTTVVTILLCFAFLIRASWRTATRLSKDSPRPKTS
ncbi:hypothetical protein CVT26_014653 [Gymnopilus dilepis]|uniref:Protein PBN1 n=1 Tax=Gymnopilus dilepis TaxID=231916 RepID=A0A409W3H7_9AGAR|nr:hypothetical protein CVT26_014653 [Gymnopilus dilepis]